MEITYDNLTDTLYIRFSRGRVAESKEIEEGLIVDYDEKGHVIGIEILNVRKKNVDLNKIVFEPEKNLPVVVGP